MYIYVELVSIWLWVCRNYTNYASTAHIGLCTCIIKYRIATNIRGVQISFSSFSVYQNENLSHKT